MVNPDILLLRISKGMKTCFSKPITRFNRLMFGYIRFFKDSYCTKSVKNIFKITFIGFHRFFFLNFNNLREESKRKTSQCSEVTFTNYFVFQLFERLFLKIFNSQDTLTNLGIRSPSVMVCISCFFWKNMRDAVFITV